MLALIVLLGLVTGGLSSILCPTKVDPQVTVHLPHPNSCSKFLTCVGSNPVEQDCPAGLHWNNEQSFCDYPRASGCSRGENSDQLHQRPFNSTAVANSICLPQTSRCPLNSNPSEDVVFLKHRDCRKFYACVSTQQVELSCPPKLYWNSRACVCDYEVEAECDGTDRVIDDVPEEVDEEHFDPEDAEEHEQAEQDQEPAAEDQPEQSADEEPEVRVRRAADGSSSNGNSGSNSGSGSGSSGSGSSGSGSNGSSSSSNGQGSNGNTAQSGADIRTVSSIAVIAFTAAMSVL
ncbi:AAEL006953-PA [Aedes aegypti]|uniref:AAEL006953-PA n=2 Tax=Aedes aegypti TaxID=7159 RepID=Q174C3_AEDAE|nr:peritrophin-1-like [Aedes aegypti]EAT41402.1 AAEL006953-PA [Aedes aegypti]